MVDSEGNKKIWSGSLRVYQTNTCTLLMFTNRKRVYSCTYAIYLDHGIVTWNSLLGLIHPALHHIIVWLHKVLLWEKTNKQTNKQINNVFIKCPEVKGDGHSDHGCLIQWGKIFNLVYVSRDSPNLFHKQLLSIIASCAQERDHKKNPNMAVTCLLQMVDHW